MQFTLPIILIGPYFQNIRQIKLQDAVTTLSIYAKHVGQLHREKNMEETFSIFHYTYNSIE